MRATLGVSAVFLVTSASTVWSDPTPAPSASPTEGATTDALYVPGAYQDWKPASAPTIKQVPDKPGMFEGYVYFSGDGERPFKFTNAPDWVHTNYGNGGDGKLNTDGQAGGLTAPGPGYYELTADLNKNTWTATKTDWSVVGDATPGGWDNDTKMTYDPEKQIWTVVVAMKQTGAFKFRANGAWKIDFGVDNSNNVQYADNPFFTYNPNLKGLTVPADGTYTITLDLHNSGNYTYNVVQN